MIEILFAVILFITILFAFQEDDLNDLASVLGIGAFTFGFILLITSL